ncbi:MAG: hypothetical protein E6G51_06820 [Actinobacteria bacterium]|nr:MAG: hypothetical protein E6G51_06820 [Actinomycetota bacterium]
MNLRSLMQAAETGAQFPPLKVMAGGALYIGYVGTKAQQEEALRANLSEHFFELEKPKRRSDAEEVYGRATAQGSQLAETLGTDDSTPTLALLNCQVWPSGGDGVESRVVYLPLNAIDSWWIGSQSRLKGRRQGSFFAGVLVPIDGE